MFVQFLIQEKKKNKRWISLTLSLALNELVFFDIFYSQDFMGPSHFTLCN